MIVLCSTSLPRLLFWGSVNTGFRLGLLSVVRTIGHPSTKMLNVSIKSICLLRQKRSWYSFFFLLIHKYWGLLFLFALLPYKILLDSVMRPLPVWKKKEKKSHKFNQVITICDNQLLFAQLSCGKTWMRQRSCSTCHVILSCDLHLKCCHVYLHISDKTSHFSY